MTKNKRALSLFMAMVLIFLQSILIFAEDVTDTQPEPVPLTILAQSSRVVKGKQITLAVNKEGEVTWSSSDTTVASVDKNGVVSTFSIGTVTITATLCDSKESAQFMLHVTGKKFFWRDLLESRQILGYRYSYIGNYYYTDDKNCWQENFGFNFAYDVAAPLVLIQYDYVRVFFTYGGYDWMIQMWKGQYGLLFHGSEIGVYTKPEGSETASRYAHYSAAGPENYLKMGSSLYHKEKRNEDYEFEFERPYDSYWWCTGFVPGHLRNTLNCKELRTDTHITLKDEEMTRLFCEGLVECGFTQVDDKQQITSDTFACEGSDVYLQWQNITGAANHATHASIWGIVGVNGILLAIFTMFAMLLLSVSGLGIFLIILI